MLGLLTNVLLSRLGNWRIPSALKIPIELSYTLSHICILSIRSASAIFSITLSNNIFS